MNTEDTTQPPVTEAAQAPRAAAVRLTNNQVKASARANAIAVRAKWKTLITDAKATWGALHTEELARVDGDFHRLAGLVQLRCNLSRDEADRQTKAFFAKHYPAG